MLEPATLRANSVRFIGATASAVGIQAPTAGVTFLPALMAAIVGDAGPLAFLLALVAMLLVSYAFIVFAADFASAGSVFAFNGRALGAGYGFISAWLLLGVYIAYSASIYASNANFLESLFGPSRSIPWPVFALLVWALALVLAYRRISVSTLLIFALEGVAIVLVAVVAVAVIAKGGFQGHGISGAIFNPGGVPLATIGLGVIFAFTGFSGFEVSATLGEETRRARRVIPASMLAALLVSGGIYVAALVGRDDRVSRDLPCGAVGAIGRHREDVCVTRDGDADQHRCAHQWYRRATRDRERCQPSALRARP